MTDPKSALPSNAGSPRRWIVQTLKPVSTRLRRFRDQAPIAACDSAEANDAETNDKGHAAFDDGDARKQVAQAVATALAWGQDGGSALNRLRPSPERQSSSTTSGRRIP